MVAAAGGLRGSELDPKRPDRVLPGREHFKKAGAVVKSDGLTVLLPKALVEDAIASAPSRIILHGRKEENNIILEGSRVHYGTGGTAIYVIDMETGERRPSTVEDIRLNARIIDALPYINLFTINVFPNDIKEKEHILTKEKMKI